MAIQVLDEIAAMLAEINEADVDRSARALSPVKKGEKKIGEAWRTDIHKVWALADKLEGQQMELAHRAKYGSANNDERDALVQEAWRYDTLSDLVRDIFWAQVRDDLGKQTHSIRSMGLREKFVVVELKPDNPIAKMLGLPIQFPLPED